MLKNGERFSVLRQLACVRDSRPSSFVSTVALRLASKLPGCRAMIVGRASAGGRVDVLSACPEREKGEGKGEEPGPARSPG